MNDVHIKFYSSSCNDTSVTAMKLKPNIDSMHYIIKQILAKLHALLRKERILKLRQARKNTVKHELYT